MKPEFSKTLLALAVSSSALLAAGGGGGGGDNSSSLTTGGSVTAASITASNSKNVGAQAYSGTDALNSQVGSGSALVTGVSTSTGSNGLLNAALQQLYLAVGNAGPTLVTGVSVTETVPCSGGGTVQFTINTASTEQFSAGDTISVTGGNCVEDGAKLNGTLNMVFNSISGTPTPTAAWSASIGMTFINFSVEAGGISSTANGDSMLNYSQTSAASASLSATGNSLQMRTVQGTSTIDRTLSAYNYSASVNASNQYTYRADFTLQGNLGTLGNAAFTVKTITDFKQVPGSFPTAGALIATAADKSSLTLTVKDGTSVQIDVDKDGNGTVDSTSTATWTELSGLL